MKFLKNNLKVIIAFIIGLILAGGIVYAATSANQVTYTTSKNEEVQTVADALNDLYKNKNEKKTIFNGIVGYELGNTTFFYYAFNSIYVNSDYIQNSTKNTNIDNSSLTLSFTIKKSCNIKIALSKAVRGGLPTTFGEVKVNGIVVSDLSSVSVLENDIITIYFNNTSFGGSSGGGGGCSILMETI